MKRVRLNIVLLTLASLVLAFNCLTLPVAAANIAGAGGHSLGLKANGIVVAWGENSQGQCNVPASLQVPGAAMVVSARGLHSLALKADGTVMAWGWNDYGPM